MKKKFGIILTIMLFVTLCLALSACNAIPKHTHDDGDCTTEAICAVCNEVLTAAKVHASSRSWSIDDRQHWKVCTNNGCTKLAVEMTNHTPIKDDGNCTTTITCSECQVVTTTAKAHTPADWSNTDSQHWKTCTNVGCTIFVEEKTNHTPIADDGNCTTVITCSECQVVTTAAKKHAPADWNKDDSQHWKTCTNEGCTRLVVEKATHTMKNDSNACECGNIVDLSIFTITDGLLSSCIPETYTSITIPNSVTSIGEGAFAECSGLTSITIPSSVTSIGLGAFAECIGLTSITIPNSVTNIGAGVFMGCSGLTSITLAEGNTTYHSAGNCIIETATKTLVLGYKNSVIPTDGSVTSIGFGAFAGSGLTSITIPEGVTSIDISAFARCTLLTSITLPSSVTSIGEGAFAYCIGLTSIIIPENVTTIGTYTFAMCIKLTNITIPKSVTDISDSAFDECRGLTSITYSGTTAEWKAITKGTGLSSTTGNYTINCTDGTLSKEPSIN